MRNIVIMDELYRVSEANYRRFLRAFLSQSPMERDGAGDYLGRSCGRIERLTDMTPYDAKLKLNASLGYHPSTPV